MFALSNVLSRMDQVPQYTAEVACGMDGRNTDCVRIQPVFAAPIARRVPVGVYLLMFGVGLVVFGLSVAVNMVWSHVPANRAIVIMLFELVIAALGAYFLAGEAMTTREWIGGAMIISASLFSSRMNRA